MADGPLKQRLAAILAADATGYSRLMSLDERATVAALDESRKVFRSHIELNQGRVIDMAGDSVLAVFETAVGAVSAALAVQAELAALVAEAPEDRRMRFRIGIHLGDVIEKPDGTVYGDGVNIAARLEGLAEPGGITVSESIHTAVRGKVTASFTDQGEQSVKNIAYPVRAYAVTAQAGPTPTPTPAIDLSLPDKPSIAVLPFANMSSDPEQEFFTDGVTEDIITELSRFHALFVIARNSSFTYKGKAVDVKQVGKELGVRYVLEGSIRRAGKRVRVTGQLIDTLSGSHLWAEKYDRDVEDIFDVQDELTRSIVSAISAKIGTFEIEKASRKRPESLTAYEKAVRGFAAAYHGYEFADAAKFDEAMQHGQDALQIDSRSRDAYLVIAYAQFFHYLFATAQDVAHAWKSGMEAATTAIGIDPADHRGFAVRAYLQVFLREGDRRSEALSDAREANALNPNDSSTLVAMGRAETALGNPAKGIGFLQQALRLNPRDPLRYHIHVNLSFANFVARDYPNGLEAALRSIELAPKLVFAHYWAALNSVALGQYEQARLALERARQLAPGFVELRLNGGVAGVTAEVAKRVQIFLRIAAGLEDPSAADALR